MRNRIVIFVGLVVVCLLAGGGYISVAVKRDAGPAAAASIETVPTSNAIVFRNASGGVDKDRVAFSGLDDLASRKLAALKCDRVYFVKSEGLCAANNAQRTGFVAKFIDEKFETLGEVPLGGIPSRVRISPDGRYGATTVFVLGHGYADGKFSTETLIIDMVAKKRVANLEEFTTNIDGKKLDAPDVNYWGVTYTADSNRFYATVASGNKKWLVEGDVSTRTMRNIYNDVECPSLSPDGKHIVYKLANADRTWRLHVLDLATMTDKVVAEPRSIDDQVEWLDNDTLIYGVVESNIYRVPADGSGAPALLMKNATSPAVLRG